MYDRRIKLIKNNSIGIADDSFFAIIINKTKVSGNYVNTIHDLIHGENNTILE